jgi:hypothetical protein
MLSDWIPAINVPSLLLGAVLGTLISTWYGFFLRRPKIRISGGGGGGGPGPGYHHVRISITNEHGLFGIRIPENTILGFRINREKQLGIGFERSPARKCSARVYDKETGDHIKALWLEPRGGGEFVRTVTLNSDEGAEVHVFARLHGQEKYFIYEPTSATDRNPVVPPPNAMFDGTRTFILEVGTSTDSKKHKTEVTIRRSWDGRLSWQATGGGGGSF